MSSNCFQLQSTAGAARAGWLIACDGTRLPTPLFQPVATAGSLKTLDWNDVRALGYRHVLMNTYHLVVRPGVEALAQFGGVKAFTRWNGSVLTDSGGYQAFSLARRRKLQADGIAFQDHIGGDMHHFTPESTLRAQLAFGVDFAMCLDVCTGQDSGESDSVESALAAFSGVRNEEQRGNAARPEAAAKAAATGGQEWTGATRSRTAQDMELTHVWARQQAELWPEIVGAQEAWPADRISAGTAEPGVALPPRLFGIVQGGLYEDLRAESIELIAGLPFDGVAVGGLAVGEPRAEFQRLASFCGPRLPLDRARYLMGLGDPADLLFAIAHGYDMFDCVQPTRMARHGVAYTWQGKLALRQERFKHDTRTLDPGSGGAGVPAPHSSGPAQEAGRDARPTEECSRAYLRHLFTLKEHSYARLLTLHNLGFYAALLAEARRRILDGSYGGWWPGIYEQVDRMLPEGL